MPTTRARIGAGSVRDAFDDVRPDLVLHLAAETSLEVCDGDPDHAYLTNTVATKYIRGYGIRVAFGLCVIGCGLSIILKMLAKGIPSYGGFFNGSATVLILGLVSAMSIYIFVRMIAGARRELAAKKSGAPTS